MREERIEIDAKDKRLESDIGEKAVTRDGKRERDETETKRVIGERRSSFYIYN